MKKNSRLAPQPQQQPQEKIEKLDELLLMEQVIKLTSLSKRTIERMSKTGEFPRMIYPRPRMRRFSRRAVEKWIKDITADTHAN